MPDGLAVLQQSSGAYSTVGSATPYIADINGTVISYKVSIILLYTKKIALYFTLLKTTH